MDKLLKALTVVLLLLSIAALVLGMKLFKMREVLKGRNQQLQTAVIKVGAAIESGVTAPTETPDLPEKDTSDCTTEVLEEPAMSDIWNDYDLQLEVQENPTLDLQSKRQDLMNYYKKVPGTQQIMIDPNGRPVTEGEGTMHDVLQTLLDSASDQYARLNRTRQQLTDTRKEFVKTIDELNTRKQELRKSLKNAADLKAQIDPLKVQIAQLEDRNESLEQEKREFDNRILDLKDQMARIEEQSQNKDDTINQLEAKLDECEKGRVRSPGPQTTSGGGTEPEVVPPPELPSGTKGVVVGVNDQWNFVILDLSDEFLKELLGDDLSKPMAKVELSIKRPGAQDKFITKVRLTQVRKEKGFAIADILSDWQQGPVQEGDVVYTP